MVNIVRISVAEFSKEASRYQDVALTQPVIVTSDDHDRTVMISAEEYRRLKRRDRQVFASGELPDEIFEALQHTEMDPKHRYLDDLIPDWTPWVFPGRSPAGSSGIPASGSGSTGKGGTKASKTGPVLLFSGCWIGTRNADARCAGYP